MNLHDAVKTLAAQAVADLRYEIHDEATYWMVDSQFDRGLIEQEMINILHAIKPLNQSVELAKQFFKNREKVG